MKKILLTLLTALLLFVSLTSINNVTLGDQIKPSVVIEPEVVELSPTSKVNDTFTITLKLYNCTQENIPAGIQAIEVKFFFGNITNYAIPVSYQTKVGKTEGVLNPTVLVAKDGLYNENGTKLSPPYLEAAIYWVAAASMGDPWYGAEGIIATITFKVINKPSINEGAFKSTLKIVYSELSDSSFPPTQIYPQNKDGIFKIVPSPAVFNIKVMKRDYQVIIESDAAISAHENLDINLTDKSIRFNATVKNRCCKCKVIIPKALMNALTEDWRVFLNQTEITVNINENTTHTSIQILLTEAGFYIITVKSTWIVRATILFSISPLTINLGENVTIGGQVLGIEGSTNVIIYYKKENEDWRQLAAIRTDPEGNFTYSWRPTDSGYYYFKVSITIEGESIESDTVSLRVGSSEAGGFEAALLTLALIIVVVVVIVTLMLGLMRKRKHSLEADTSTELR